MALRSAAQHKAACDKGVESKMMFDAMTRWMIDKDPSFLE
jgi:hypothetical protein